jgi:endonuclease/exonuclease/phosphatase (EEP) superfamily protein YafD
MWKLSPKQELHLARTLRVIILGITAIALIARGFGWPMFLELFSHFQFQYFILVGLGWVGLAMTRRRSGFWVGCVCTVALATQIVPWYLPPHFLAAKDGNFRLLIFNLHRQNTQYEAVLDFVQQVQPDLALFMEVNDAWVASFDTLAADLPYTMGHIEPVDFGMMLYSRFPLENTQIQRWKPDTYPSFTGQMTIQGKSLAFTGTHPLPPYRPDFFQSRNQQLEQVGQYLQTVSGPQILLGDLNVTPWSPYYQRLVRRTGLKNARQGFGLLPSWPTAYPTFSLPGWVLLLLSIPIDHCLLSPELSVVNVQVGPGLGSDHRPLMVDLQLSSGGGQR